MSEKQFYLLQVNDALFPIGGYSHSQGLETYIQRGIVHNVDTAREYITHKIKWNLAYTELLAARLAYEAAEKKDLQELLYLEELLEAQGVYRFQEFIRKHMEIEDLAEQLIRKNPRFVMVTDEIGYGLVPVEEEARNFRERTGRICTKLAAHCERVERIVCGIPTRIR